MSLNSFRWDGRPGHYEVYYLTLTDPGSGIGIWIRYTMLASLPRVGEPASAALWFLAMDPRGERPVTLGRKATFAIEQLRAVRDPFELRVAGARLTDSEMSGSFDDVSWDLRWTPSDTGYEHVHPVLRRLRVAKTVLVLPHADLLIDGTVELAGERLELAGARGGQAHLWGSKHATSWAWAHCSDFRTPDGEPRPDCFVDGVSVVVSRGGREIGPSTPVVGRIDGRDFRSISPLRVLRNRSSYELTGWRFEALDGSLKLVGEVQADRRSLAGVTYHDPDGDLAYCYNSEIATMRLQVYERARTAGGWAHRISLVSDGAAHFEYAQRTPVPDIELHTP